MAPEEVKRRHRGHAFIPAGIFIGLGVGIIAGYVVAGILIGLGLGFLASAFISGREEPDPSADTPHPCGFVERRWMPVVIGIFLILAGIGIVWMPPLAWPYLIGGFLILIGIGFTLRGFRK